jgi:hypothetical protein
LNKTDKLKGKKKQKKAGTILKVDKDFIKEQQRKQNLKPKVMWRSGMEKYRPSEEEKRTIALMLTKPQRWDEMTPHQHDGSGSNQNQVKPSAKSQLCILQ